MIIIIIFCSLEDDVLPHCSRQGDVGVSVPHDALHDGGDYVPAAHDPLPVVRGQVPASQDQAVQDQAVQDQAPAVQDSLPVRVPHVPALQDPLPTGQGEIHAGQEGPGHHVGGVGGAGQDPPVPDIDVPAMFKKLKVNKSVIEENTNSAASFKKAELMRN